MKGRNITGFDMQSHIRHILENLPTKTVWGQAGKSEYGSSIRESLILLK